MLIFKTAVWIFTLLLIVIGAYRLSEAERIDNFRHKVEDFLMFALMYSILLVPTAWLFLAAFEVIVEAIKWTL